MRPSLRIASLLASAVASLVGCAAAPETEPAATTDAPLTRTEFDAAVRHLGRLVYLPWGYTDDGCYARAYYYTMTLAGRGIPSNQLYFVAKERRAPYLIAGRWNYHVAPMVTLDDEPANIYILDPLFNGSAPMPLASWINAQDGSRADPATRPDVVVHPGSSYQTPYDLANGELVASPLALTAEEVARVKEPSFGALDEFRPAMINRACATMHAYIDREGAPNRADKHLMLAMETRRLTRALAQRGKLGDGAIDDSCTTVALDEPLGVCSSASRGGEEMEHGACVHNGQGWFRCDATGGGATWVGIGGFVEPGEATPAHPGCTRVCRYGEAACDVSVDATRARGG